MKVRGDKAPPGAFTVESVPNHKGFALARFYENAVPYEETREGQTMKGWEYNEYQLELRDTGNLAADIEGNFDVYYQEAKLAEHKKNPPSLEQMRADMDYIMVMTDLL